MGRSLDLAERQDNVAPEVARLAEAEQTLKENEAQIVHLERLLSDTKEEPFRPNNPQFLIKSDPPWTPS